MFLRSKKVHQKPIQDVIKQTVAVPEIETSPEREIASAAELVMGKTARIPVAVLRGIDRTWLRTSSISSEVVRPPSEDLFR